jgi:hypothetical protein
MQELQKTPWYSPRNVPLWAGLALVLLIVAGMLLIQ